MTTKEMKPEDRNGTSDENSSNCQTCGDPVDLVSSRLVCENCHSLVHIACLQNKALPTNLLGDTFFVLVCKNCSTIPKIEVIKRDKVNWLSALVLAMYNLRLLSPEDAREGFFHWKLHVAAFLEQNWVTLFGPQMKKRKTWLGTISGTMSHWSGVIFRSGLVSLKESGWWKLISEEQPRDLLASAPSSISRTGQGAVNGISLLKKNKTEMVTNSNDLQESNQDNGILDPSFNRIAGNVLTATGITSNRLVQERKRTRGVQSSIVSAMALKEKRSTLLEAKEIRKAKQQQLENEIQEHQQRQQTQQSAYLNSSKNENTSIHLNSSHDLPSKIRRLDLVNKVTSFNEDLGSRRSSTDSTNFVADDILKQEKVLVSREPENLVIKKEIGAEWYQREHLIGAPTNRPPISLFNEEDQDQESSQESRKIKTELEHEGDNDISPNKTWSTIDILLNRRGEDGKDTKTSLDLVEDSGENSAADFSSVTDNAEEDLVSEVMSQSQNSFPNVEELVSGLSPTTLNISCTNIGSSKTVIYSHNLMENHSPMSSHACSSSIASSEDTYEDQRSSIGSPSSIGTREEKELASEESMDVVQSMKGRYLPTITLDEEIKVYSLIQNSKKSFLNKSNVRNLMRKLEIRNQKRSQGFSVQPLEKIELQKANINLSDSSIQSNVKKSSHKKVSKKVDKSKEILSGAEEHAQGQWTPEESSLRVLDRFQIVISEDQYSSMKGCSFRTRLLGRDYHELQCVKSPHTGRMLKPYIRRDFETEPLKLRLLRELLVKTKNRRDDTNENPTRHSIDYMYVRPHHIPSVNQLARQFFWPGIDLSECLQYPDFSCVAVYRKIVIGFAFLVPDVTYIEAYVSFIFTHPEWRRKGVAKFMLYHLIQTCMGKDITLHVSANNPAILLYQKFGFKVEEYITNFYDKYLPPESKDCKNALFLRLSR